ncbi:MAG: serine/threonine protein kinase [Acidobacteria bacterium]|nr:serine/threonine protein kinase [Acidobacteriota bacterium]
MIKEGEILQERYRIGKQIGQGGMGAVYIATDERFGSTVAIKETLFTDEHFKKAFKREARLLNSLKHSALPKVSDHFIEDNRQYIVMEYIGGQDLFEMMEKSGHAFSESEVIAWTKQLLDALEYLHDQENPVIHRDIKPQNLKLTSHGQVVLLDFGLAKGNPTDANHKTAANSIFGYSRNYASLEQIQGTGTDPRSDLYSLAATVYHLITGMPPADALTRVMLVLNEEDDPLRPASEVAAVDKELCALLTRTMSLNANQRPQSASEMREMILAVENGAGFEANNTSNKRLDTNLHSQATKVMSPGSKPTRGAKTEMKTEVLPAASGPEDSVQTQIAGFRTGGAETSPERSPDPGLITRSYSSKKRLIATAFAGMAVLVGSILAGVYFLNPALLGAGVLTDPGTKSSNKPDTPVETTAGETNVNLPGKTAEINSETAPAEEVAVRPDPTKETPAAGNNGNDKSKVADVKRSEGKNTKPPGDGDIVIKDGKIISKDATVENGKIRAGDVSVENGRVIIKNKPAPPKPPISREEYRGLTPAQKRKVRAAMERWRQAENKRRAADGLPPIPPINEGPN